MHSYIVMVSPSIGGAEKRFFDIYTSLRRLGDQVFYLAPSSLIEQLKADHGDRSDVFSGLISINLKSWSRLEFIREYRKVLKQLPRNSGFHYPLNCLWPLHIGRGDKVTMSVVDCTNAPSLLSSSRTSIWAWISFFFVEKIDVLSPAVFSTIKGYSTAARMSLTPGGTYVIPTAGRDSAKLPLVVFMGRLAPFKGIEHFLDVLPDLWMVLNKDLPFDLEFKIAGYGPLESLVQSRVEHVANSGISISFIGYSSSETLLNQAAVVLSLQELTNYPSRVVAEALFAGCGVIVRDTGDSRSFGEGIPGLLYCQPKLDAVQLADQISTLLNRVILEPGFTGKVRAAAVDRFTSADYITYFRKLICVDSTFAA